MAKELESARAIGERASRELETVFESLRIAKVDPRLVSSPSLSAGPEAAVFNTLADFVNVDGLNALRQRATKEIRSFQVMR